jgi:hypothetical protein
MAAHTMTIHVHLAHAKWLGSTSNGMRASMTTQSPTITDSTFLSVRCSCSTMPEIVYLYQMHNLVYIRFVILCLATYTLCSGWRISGEEKRRGQPYLPTATETGVPSWRAFGATQVRALTRLGKWQGESKSRSRSRSRATDRSVRSTRGRRGGPPTAVVEIPCGAERAVEG